MSLTIHDLTITERPGERTKAAPDAVRAHMTSDYAADLVRRLTEQLAAGNEEFHVVMIGEMQEAE